MATYPADAKVDFEKLVPAGVAVDWLALHLGSRMIAKAELADLLRDGSLRCFARRVWDSKFRDIMKAWNEEPDEDDGFAELTENTEVFPVTWRYSKQWLADQADWRWPSGRFSSNWTLRPFCRTMVEHVHFDPDQLKLIVDRLAIRGQPLLAESLATVPPATRQLLPLDDTAFEAGSKPNRPGRHLRGEAWAAVFLKLVERKEANELDNVASFKRLTGELARATEGLEYALKDVSIAPVVRELVKQGYIIKKGTN